MVGGSAAESSRTKALHLTAGSACFSAYRCALSAVGFPRRQVSCVVRPRRRCRCAGIDTVGATLRVNRLSCTRPMRVPGRVVLSGAGPGRCSAVVAVLSWRNSVAWGGTEAVRCIPGRWMRRNAGSLQAVM